MPRCAPILLLWLPFVAAACFPRRELVNGGPGAGAGADGGGAGGADGGADGGMGPEDTGSGYDSDAVALFPDGITPDEGPSSGGRRATVSVAGAGPGVDVRFGAAAARVLEVRPDAVEVVVPPGEPGVVAVRLGAAGAEVPGGYRYWADAGGAAIAAVRVGLVFWVDGADLAADRAADAVELVAAMYAPADWGPGELWAGAGLGACGAGLPVSSPVEATGDVTVGLGPGWSLRATPAGPGVWSGEARWAPGSAEPAGLPGAPVDLSLPAGGWPGIELPGVVALPAAPGPVSPGFSEADLEIPDLDAFDLRWTAAGADEIQIEVRDLRTGAFARCRSEDTGAFRVPRAAFSGFEADFIGQYDVELTVWAVRAAAAPQDFNGGQVRVHAATGYRGRLQFLDWGP